MQQPLDSLYGIPCKVLEWLPAGTMAAYGAQGETPNNWDDMTDWEKMDWCVRHNAQVLISPDVWKALKESAAERELWNDSQGTERNTL